MACGGSGENVYDFCHPEVLVFLNFVKLPFLIGGVFCSVFL
jgi:hypothetical protein